MKLVDFKASDKILLVDYENITDYNDRTKFLYPKDKLIKVRYNHPLYFLINFAFHNNINKIFIVFKSPGFIRKLKEDYDSIMRRKKLIHDNVTIHIDLDVIEYLKRINIYYILIDSYLYNMGISMDMELIHSLSGYDDALLMVLINNLYNNKTLSVKSNHNIHLMTKDNNMFIDFNQNKKYLLPFNISLYKLGSPKCIYNNMVVSLKDYNLSFDKTAFDTYIIRDFSNESEYETKVRDYYFKPSPEGKIRNWVKGKKSWTQKEILIGKENIDKRDPIIELNTDSPSSPDSEKYYEKYIKYKNKYLELKSKL
jgi:hypothetical protein